MIVGAEINPRSRSIAARRFASDPLVEIGPDYSGQAPFDLIFAMAVLQFQPHVVEERGIQDLSSFYPFAKFDAEVVHLTSALRSGGLLCIMHAHYRLEDASVAKLLTPLAGAPQRRCDDLFQPNGAIYRDKPSAGSMFVRL
jgi:hypothetical protein